MSEHDSIVRSPANVAVPDRTARFDMGSPSAESTAGAVLRQARLARGIEIDAMAATLKIPVQKLQALEQDRFDLLPDPAFVRALASSVCRMLKLDPAPVLQRLPPITAFKIRAQNRGINTPFRTRDTASVASLGLQFSLPAVLLGLALLFGALVLIFLPFIQQEIAKYRPVVPTAPPKDELVEPVSKAGPPIGESTLVGTFAASSTASELAPQPAAQGFTTAAGEPSGALPSAVPAEAGSYPTLVFSAKKESRVMVTDARGAVVLSRTLIAGESAEASGAPPLAVTVGRADAVQVQVRGQAFDVAAVAKNNISRFEVK